MHKAITKLQLREGREMCCAAIRGILGN